MTTFEKIFYNSINEDVTAGAGGAFGDTSSMGHGGAFPGSSDFFEPKDSRKPKVLGAKSVKRKRKSKKRKSKKKLVKASHMVQVPFMQRTFPDTLGMAPNKTSFSGLGRNPVIGPL